MYSKNLLKWFQDNIDSTFEIKRFDSPEDFMEKCKKDIEPYLQSKMMSKLKKMKSSIYILYHKYDDYFGNINIGYDYSDHFYVPRYVSFFIWDDETTFYKAFQNMKINISGKILFSTKYNKFIHHLPDEIDLQFYQ